MLRTLRERENLTQEELGKKLGWPQGYISRYETGKVDIPLDRLIQLAKFFGVYVSNLIGEIPLGQSVKKLRDDVDDPLLRRAVTYAAQTLRSGKKNTYVPTGGFMDQAIQIYRDVKSGDFDSDDDRFSHIKVGIDAAMSTMLSLNVKSDSLSETKQHR